MSQPEPEATPQQQEAVRRLLAEARHDAALPDHVAARLDGVLAQLGAEGPRAVDPPEPTTTGSAVVDLAARRRRRVTGLLGAAAAVVVLGVGIDQVVDRTGSDGQSERSTSANDSGDGAAPAAGAEAPPEEANPAAPSAPPSDDQSDEQSTQPTATVPSINSVDFKRAVLRLRVGGGVTSYSSTQRLGATDLTTESMFVCPPTVLGPGRLVPVSYGGSPAVLAYRPPRGDTQTVELLQCGTGMVKRSVVIPAP